MSKEKLARVVGALRGERRQASRRMELEALKQHTLLALLDCADARVERLRECVSVRRDALELWALRPELYVCLSQCFDRGEAARRLNRIAPLFRGWVPSRFREPIAAPGAA